MESDPRLVGPGTVRAWEETWIAGSILCLCRGQLRLHLPLTPRKARQSHCTLVIHFQSIRSKKPTVLNLLQSSNPDIVLGTVTWLRPDMYTAEIFPPNSNVFRKDRQGGHWDVLVATKTNLIAHVGPHNTTAETVYVKIQTQRRSRPLVV